MACPACDHTMEHMTEGVFWCPRCGTIQAVALLQLKAPYCVPKLVERCRRFYEQWAEREEVYNDMVAFGIREAVCKPVDTQPEPGV